MRAMDRDARLARHYPVGPRHEGHICNACEDTWPCDVALALAEVGKLRAIRDATDHPARQALATCQALLDGIANRAGLRGRDGLDLDSLIAAGLVEVEELLGRLGTLQTALRAVVAVDPIVRYGGADFGCWFCESDASLWAVRPEQVEHAATCPWVLAKALLGEEA